MSRLWKFPNIINIDTAKTRLYCKSTDCDYIYGQDEDGRRLKYDLLTTELSTVAQEDYGKCGPNYDIRGNYLSSSDSLGIDREGLDSSDWDEMGYVFRIFLLALTNSRVGGDECIKILKLYGYETSFKLKKSYIGSLYILDADGKESWSVFDLMYSIKEKDE